MNTLRILFYFTLSLMLTACPQKDPINCTEVFVSGLVIKVTAADTNEIISKGIFVVAEDGDYSEALAFTFDSYIGAGERPGNYTITVSGEGYVTQVVGPIEVLADECHVITQNIAIGLTPN